jgi:hypothetical protein
METELTIAITAKDADAALLRLLNSLCRQDYAGLARTRVLLLTPEDPNGSDPSRHSVPASGAGSLHDAIDRFKGRLAIEPVLCGVESPAARRNVAAALATTPYVLFLDPDVELPYRAGPERQLDKSLLRRAVEAIAQRKIHLVTASVVCLHGCFLDDLLSLANNLIQRASCFLRPFAACTSIGIFLLFDRNEFLRLGGFNQQALFVDGALLSKAIPRERFHLLPGRIQTANRRMHEIGHGRIAIGLLRAMIHSGDRQFVMRDALVTRGPLHPDRSHPLWIDHNEQPLAPGQHGTVGSL